VVMGPGGLGLVTDTTILRDLPDCLGKKMMGRLRVFPQRVEPAHLFCFQ
jgi:hypothetical protein